MEELDHVHADETALNLFRRTLAKPVLTFPFWASYDSELSEALSILSLCPGEVLEISGRSSSGKTEMIYQAVLGCVLPRIHDGIPFGGADASCVVIDLDYRFNILRFNTVFVSCIKKAMSKGSYAESAFFESESYKSLRVTVFERVFVSHCQSPIDLLAAVRYVEKLVQDSKQAEEFDNAKAERSAKTIADVRLVVIDNIAAFYHMKKLNDKLSYFDKLTDLLNGIISSNRLSLVVSKPVLFSKSVGEIQNQLRNPEYLGRVWNKFVKYRVVLNYESGMRLGRLYVGEKHFDFQVMLSPNGIETPTRLK